MLRDGETYEFEGQTYVDPNVSLNESLGFIANLRDIQQQNNAQISADTKNLGTDIASSMGGLLGGSGYWTSRVQTPQTNALVADLRASAQASALNDILKNEQAKMKKRYNNAYKAARKRANAGGGGGDPTINLDDLIDLESTTQTVGSVEPNFSPATSGTFSFTPNDSPFSSGNSGLNAPATPSQIQNAGNSLWPAGNIDVQRNASGAIINLRYNGKSYQGDAGQKMWERLVENGKISPAGN